MSVISFFNSKGGAGKTTSCILLAQVLAKKSFKVLVIDADPNYPLDMWVRGRKSPSPFEVIKCGNEEEVVKQISRGREAFDFVLVDLEGTKNVKAAYAVSKSDITIIPMQRSNLDQTQAAQCIGFLQVQSQVLERPIAYTLSLTKTSPAIRSKALKRTYKTLEDGGLNCLNVELYEREGFKNLFDYSSTLYELMALKPDDQSLKKCIENAEAFTDDVLRFIAEYNNTRKVA